MRLWQESQEEVITIMPDMQMASAILRMIEVRMKALEELKNKPEFVSLIVEDYYGARKRESENNRAKSFLLFEYFLV